MPQGTFLGAGVNTIVLFFIKGEPTRRVWFYKLNPGRKLGKTNALNDEDLVDFVNLQANFLDSENSWSIDAKDIDEEYLKIQKKKFLAQNLRVIRFSTFDLF